MPAMGVYKKPKGAKLVYVAFRLTVAQKAALQKAAADKGLCPADFCRIAAFKEMLG